MSLIEEGKSIDQLRATRMARLGYLESQGIDAYPPEPPPRTATNSELIRRYDELAGNEVHAVGRITAVRGHGKLIFFDIEDGTGNTRSGERGKIQVMMDAGGVGEKQFGHFERGYDAGDIVRVSGVLGQTRTGETTIKARDFGMLAKAILPPPTKKEGGLTDLDILRRKRYLDLMSNPEAREKFRIRSAIVQQMREHFMRLGNLEVETPVLDTTYGGANARPFTTHHNALGQEMYLRISNELYLKRLIVGMLGVGSGVFEFSKDFRNEGMDATHHPEFTQVELYMPYTDYNYMMDMTEELYKAIVSKITGRLQVRYGDQFIDFSSPWRRLTIYDGLRENLGIDPKTINETDLRKLAQSHGIDPTKRRGYVLMELFEKLVEPKIGFNPTFVLDYPKDTSPLTKRHRQDTGLAERFELFVGGMEVGNCYTELNDPRDQRQRFEEETRRRRAGDTEAQPEDEDFITSMEHGLPPMGGIGLSIDRLTMILTDTRHIQDVILFPHQRR